MVKLMRVMAFLCSVVLFCGVSHAEVPVSAEVAYAIDSKHMNYGIINNNEPIQTISAYLTFFDWLSVGAETIFDLTSYGRKAGYTSRSFQCNEFSPNISLGYIFSPDEFEKLPTTVVFELCYTYEYLPRVKGRWDNSWAEDSQFWTLMVALPDLWLEPRFYYERDTDRDDGTYLNLAFGHTFSLVDGEEEGAEPVLLLCPSVAQGFGNGQRVGGYLFHNDGEFTPLGHAGLMDTLAKLTLTWNVCEGVKLSIYAGYNDFLFDRKIREAARYYEAAGKWDHSWSFICGCAIKTEF